MESSRYTVFDDYGLHHLTRHLYDLRTNAARRQALYRLISMPFMREKQRRTLSHRSFVDDVSLAIKAASEEDPPNLAQEVRDCLLTATLRAAASTIPPGLLAVMAGVGQVERAMEHASLVEDVQERCRAYLAIAQELLTRNKREKAVVSLQYALDTSKITWQRPFLDEYNELESFGWDQGMDADNFADLWAQDMEPQWTKNDALREIAQGFARAGVLEQALEAANRVEKQYAKDKVLSAIGCVLVQEGHLDRVWQLMERIDSGWERDSMLVEVVRLLIREGALDPAREVAYQMEVSYRRNLAFAELAEAFAAAGRIDFALEIIDQVRKGEHDLEESSETKEHRSRGWIAVAAAFLDRQQVDRARGLIDLIYQSSLREVDLSRLIPVVLRMGDYDRAIDAVVQSLPGVWQWYGWPYKTEALQELGDALASLSSIMTVSDLREMIERLEYEEERVYLLTCLARSLKRKAPYRQVTELLRESRLRVEKIEVWDTSVGFSSSMVPGIFDYVKKTLLHAVAAATSEVMGPDSAVTFIERIEDRGDRIVALTALATSLAGEGFSWAAVKIADRVLQASESVPRSYDRDQMIKTIAEMLARTHMVEKVPTAITSITSERAREAAWKTVEEVRGAGFEEHAADGSFVPPEDLEAAIAQARQAFAAKSKDAFDYGGFADMPYSMKREARKGAMVESARDMACLGDVEGAMEAVDVLDRATYQAEASRAVAKGLALGGWTDRAVAVARGISDEDQRVGALRDIAKALDEAGHAEAALGVWQIALQRARWVGCTGVFEVLADGASLLARLDEGRTLWDVYKAVRELESWWERV